MVDKQDLEQEFLTSLKRYNRWFFASRLAMVSVGVSMADYYDKLTHGEEVGTALAVGMASALLVDGLWTVAKKGNPLKKMYNLSKTLVHEVRKNTGEQRRVAGEKVFSGLDPSYPLLRRLDATSLDDGVDSFLLALRDVYGLLGKYSIRKSCTDLVVSPVAVLMTYGLARLMTRNSVKNYLSWTDNALSSPSLYWLADHCFNRCAAIDPAHDVEWDLLRGMWYEARRDSVKSHRYFASSLEGLLIDKRGNFSRVGNSRHEVVEFSGSNLLCDAYIFKRDDIPYSPSLMREKLVAEALRDHASHNSSDFFLNPSTIPCEEPLGLFQEGKVLVTRRVRRKSLDNLLVAGKDLTAEYGVAVKNWLLLAANATIPDKDLPVHDYVAEFHLRVARPDRFGRSILEAYRPFVHSLQNLSFSLPRVLAHRDAAVSNVLEGGYWIDFETAGFADPLLDIATLSVREPNGAAFFSCVWPLLNNYYPYLDKKSAEELFYRVRVHNGLCQAAAAHARSISPQGTENDKVQARQCLATVRTDMQLFDANLAVQINKYVPTVLRG
ncbi:MAG: hypothetical protein Q7R56_02605 [Nanoarchaeota archaeon]|nr:hypothetical protein [Nanoarchaeota archaeon]